MKEQSTFAVQGVEAFDARPQLREYVAELAGCCAHYTDVLQSATAIPDDGLAAYAAQNFAAHAREMIRSVNALTAENKRRLENRA